MDSLIHIITTIVTIVFIAAVLYSLTSALRKRHRKAKVQQELAKKEHVKVANLHQYDIKPNDGYYKYPIEEKGKLRRFPQHFTAVALELANEQPYSVCLLALAEFDHGELKDTRYFYVRPPENNLPAVKGRYQWEELSKADEFGEYWQAGLKNLIEGQTLVAHNAPFVMGCLTHALHIYGIDAPAFCYADTLEVAKKLYHFPSNQLDVICDEMDIQTEEGNLLSQAIAIGRFFLLAHKEYPMFLPDLTYVQKAPTTDDKEAALIAAVEREEGTPEEMFAPGTPDPALIDDLVQKGYVEAGEKPGTYYAMLNNRKGAAPRDIKQFIFYIYNRRARTMKIIPLADRVVIKTVEVEETTKGGLILTGSAKEKPQVAQVVAVGPGGVVDGKEVKMTVKVGDKVLTSKYSGTEVKVDGEECTIVRQADILAIVE